MLDHQRPCCRGRTCDISFQAPSLESCRSSRAIRATKAEINPQSVPRAPLITGSSPGGHGYQRVNESHSLANELRESSVRPPMSGARDITFPYPAAQQSQPLPCPFPAALPELTRRVPAGKGSSSDAPRFSCAHTAAGMVKLPWAALQEETAASAVYAARVQQAKKLLDEFDVYQQQSNRGSGSGIRRGGCAGFGAAGTHPQRSGSWLASYNCFKGEQVSAAADASHVLVGPHLTPQDAKTNHVHGSDKGMGNAAAIPSLAPTSATESCPPRPIAPQPSLQRSLDPVHENPPPLQATPGVAVLETSNSSFSPTAFEVAKLRARRLLSYNAKARSAFSDQGLSLTRAVYKELLRAPPSAPALALEAQTSSGGEAAQVPTFSAVKDCGVDPPGDTPPSTSRPAVLSSEGDAAAHRGGHGAAVGAPTTAAAAETEAEARRALDLLCTIRAMRRQTEGLTVALLHACGEWNCWDAAAFAHASPASKRAPPRQHLFSDLFLSGSTTPGEGAPMGAGEERSPAARYEEEMRDRGTRACAVLRKALRLPSKPIKDGDVDAACLEDESGTRPVELHGAAVAFLELAEAPLLRRVPPPPPTSMQLELFATQQSSLRDAQWRLQALAPQSSASADAPGGQETRNSVTAPPPPEYGASLSVEGGGVYNQFQRQLHELRVQRRSVQHTYEALCAAAASKERGEPRRISQVSSSSPLSPTQPPQSDSVGPNVQPAGAPSTLNSIAECRAPAVDTLLSTPPAIAVERTRPWIDSMGEEAGEETRLRTPDGAAAATSVPVTQKEAAQRAATEALRPPSPTLFSPSPLSSPPDVRDGLTSHSASAVPSSSKARVYAAATAARVCLFSSSVSSTDSALQRPHDSSSVHRHACPPAGPLSFKESSPEGAGKGLLAGDRPGVEAAPSSVADNAPAPISEEGSSAAALPPGLVKRPSPGRTPSSAVSVKRACTAPLTDTSRSATPQVKAAPEKSRSRQEDAADGERKGGETEERHGAATGPPNQRKAEDSTVSEDDYSSGTLTSNESTSHDTSSCSGSYDTASHTSCRDSSQCVYAAPHACAASWHPYMNAALSTHAGAADAAAEVERRAREGAGFGKPRESRSGQRVDQRLIGGLDAAAYDRLLEWASTQRRQNRRGALKKSEVRAVAASTLSPADVKVVSRWLRNAAGAKHARQRSLNRTEATRGDATAASGPFPLPLAVQRALHLLDPEYTPQTPPSVSDKAAPTGTNAKPDQPAMQRAKLKATEVDEARQLPCTSSRQAPLAGSSALAEASDTHSTASRKKRRELGAARSDPTAASACSPLPQSLSVAASDSSEADTGAGDAAAPPSVHPRMRSATAASTPPQRNSARHVTPAAGVSNKVVKSPRKKSFLKRLFSCIG
ncbi:hypothetical protein ABL78_5135 [Leptomonas seymouri]|uniref:Uncharacterized protein n=1 Tax=Leptomonas seymouri TaxID=5684 RepID=A0A0N0P5B5_LEPSE|nr:hypothetical protein ABL78_5135 [Leptomonas seymouri]|eukprot:KPI85807.1 hypothetical protein ABL78_5135 [Leptomonas seymouri]